VAHCSIDTTAILSLTGHVIFGLVAAGVLIMLRRRATTAATTVE